MAFPPWELAGAVALFIILVVAGVVRSYKTEGGILFRAFNREDDATEEHRRKVNEMHDTVDGIANEVHETKERVEDLEDTVDEGFRMMAVIHKDDDDVDGQALRRRLEVNGLDDDILED